VNDPREEQRVAPAAVEWRVRLMGLERDLLALAATLRGPWRVTEEHDGKFFLRSSHLTDWMRERCSAKPTNSSSI
jgi:hypothetical protein